MCHAKHGFVGNPRRHPNKGWSECPKQSGKPKTATRQKHAQTIKPENQSQSRHNKTVPLESSGLGIIKQEGGFPERYCRQVIKGRVVASPTFLIVWNAVLICHNSHIFNMAIYIVGSLAVTGNLALNPCQSQSKQENQQYSILKPVARNDQANK